MRPRSRRAESVIDRRLRAAMVLSKSVYKALDILDLGNAAVLDVVTCFGYTVLKLSPPCRVVRKVLGELILSSSGELL